MNRRNRHQDPHRILAHESMRELWIAANRRVRRGDAEVREYGGVIVRTVEPDVGISIERFGDQLSIDAEFEKNDGTQETVTLTFPEDIRDLNETVVTVDWYDGERSGTNTPPLKDYPKIAKEVLALIAT